MGSFFSKVIGIGSSSVAGPTERSILFSPTISIDMDTSNQQEQFEFRLVTLETDIEKLKQQHSEVTTLLEEVMIYLEIPK